MKIQPTVALCLSLSLHQLRTEGTCSLPTHRLQPVEILLFLSGLQSIPGSLYEAASVEGATAWESFWKITVPMISPIILVNVIFTIIDSFTSYSNGLMQYILSETSQLHYSYAAAMTWIYFAAIMAVLGAILGLVSKKIFYSVE